MTGQPEGARGRGVPVLRYEALASSMDEARRLAEAGRDDVWVVCREQLSGRGRCGRGWSSPPGNLYASRLVVRPCLPARLGEICFVAGLALRDAAAALAGPGTLDRLRLKWPNDLLLDGAKVAGILVETAGTGRDAAQAVVVGFGVNCVRHPEDTPYAATDFAAAGLDIAPEALLAHLAPAFEARRAEWRAGEGFAATRAAWLGCAAHIGREVTIRIAGEAVTGRFETVTKDGWLSLVGADGRRRLVPAGEVFFSTREGTGVEKSAMADAKKARSGESGDASEAT